MPSEKTDYEKAVAIVVEHQRASISLVQRKLRIGYNAAARLLEQMQELKVISPPNQNGHRDVLFGPDYKPCVGPGDGRDPGGVPPAPDPTGNTPGHRMLSADEVALINDFDTVGAKLEELIKRAQDRQAAVTAEFGTPDGEAFRWLAISKTHFQEGLMAARRAIAKPTNF